MHQCINFFYLQCSSRPPKGFEKFFKDKQETPSAGGVSCLSLKNFSNPLGGLE